MNLYKKRKNETKEMYECTTDYTYQLFGIVPYSFSVSYLATHGITQEKIVFEN